MKKYDLQIFLHIHKTGGSTLQGIINRNFSKRKMVDIPNLNASNLYGDLPADKKMEISIVKGHFPYGIHEFANTSDFTYISMLRNPVERVISAYYYVHTRPNLPLHKTVTENRLSLGEFVTSGVKGIIENGQTKMLAGVLDIEYGTCDENVYNKAIENIESHFSVVGLSEMFDESVLLMAKELGWTRPWYTRANITKNKKKRSDLSVDEIAVIEKYNQWDIKLYEYCKNRLVKQWHENPGLVKKLESYRRKNRLMEKLKKITNIFSRS